MVQTLDTTLVVHAQESFKYTQHALVGNIKKYVDSKPSLNLYVDGFGQLLFPTKYGITSDNTGEFNPEEINTYLIEQGINPTELTNIEIKLVGGEFSSCLRKTFKLLTEWERATYFKNDTKVILPCDAVFDITKKGKIVSLEDIFKKKDLTPKIVFYAMNEFFGQIRMTEDAIVFHYKKRDWGFFDNEGKCIFPIDKDNYWLHRV